jgi:hypothetical protein
MGWSSRCPLWVISGHFALQSAMSAFAPEADIGRRQEFVRLRATSGHCAVSLDQLVSEPEQLRWNCDAECFGSF